MAWFLRNCWPLRFPTLPKIRENSCGVSFADWAKNGWLVAHRSSKQEIANLLGIVARDLKDSQAKDVWDDWRFATAYNGALQAAPAVAGADRGEGREVHSRPGALSR